jgi:hypothetical protein
MDTMIEMPGREQQHGEFDYYAAGWQEGLKWANHAQYENLQYAVNSYVITNDIFRVFSTGYEPRADKILGDYFSRIFESCEDFQIEITKPEDSGCSKALPNEMFCLWEQGWHDAVNEFWKTIHTYDNT